MKSYFGKEILSSSIIIGGAPVPFQPIPGNHGVIELEAPKDDALITALNDLANRHVAGVYRMSEAQFLEKKNRTVLTPLQSPRRKELLRPMPKGPFERKSVAPQAPGAAPVSPAAPRPETMPLTRSAEAARSGVGPDGKFNLVERATVPPAPAPIDQAADVISQLAGDAPPAPPSPASPAAPAVTEGFRPATRRISRKAKATAAALP